MKSAYFYLVLFATLMMIIGGSVSAFMAIADIVYPAPYYQSFDEYKSMTQAEKIKNPDNNADPEDTKLSEKELSEKYNAMVSSEKERQINRAKNTLIKSFGWIIIPLPVFLYFKRFLAKKEA